MKTIIMILSFSTYIFGQNICPLSDDIILSILQNESHPQRGAGYRYLISFNNKNDVKLVKKSILRKYFLDNRTIDCKNEKLCVDITKRLWSVGIKNLDLGAFQINSKYHKFKAYTYFRFSTSYLIACDFIVRNLKKRGYTWTAVAGYHSFSKRQNEIYKEKLLKNYKDIKLWRESLVK